MYRLFVQYENWTQGSVSSHRSLEAALSHLRWIKSFSQNFASAEIKNKRGEVVWPRPSRFEMDGRP